MLISMNRVREVTWSISSNFGSTSFVTDPSLLQDNRPGTQTRFIWPTYSPNSAVAVTLEGVFSPSNSELIGILNIQGLERGNVVEIALKRVGELVYDVPVGTVVVEELSDGNLAVWAYAPTDGWLYSGIKITFQADNPDMGVVLGGTPINIGEIWLGSKEFIDIQPGWSVSYEDTTIYQDSENSAPYNVPGFVRRVFTFTACMSNLIDIYGEHGGVGTAVNLNAYISILQRLSSGRTCVCFPRWEELDAPSEERTLMARTAIFGTARRLGGFNHLNVDNYQPQQITFTEIPCPRRDYPWGTYTP